MSDDQTPHAGQCGFCEHGLLRFRQCPACYTISLVCDECELLWTDMAAVSSDPQTPAAGSFPMCPSCGSANEMWLEVSPEELRSHGLQSFCKGHSA